MHSQAFHYLRSRIPQYNRFNTIEIRSKNGYRAEVTGVYSDRSTGGSGHCLTTYK